MRHTKSWVVKGKSLLAGGTMRNLIAIRSLLFAVLLMGLSAASFAQIGISVSFGPPALPVYEQPICPGEVTSGPPDIGLGMEMIIIGCPAPGFWLPR